MRDTKKISLVMSLLVGLVGSTGALAQTVYKTVDEQGNVSYTDRPPLQQQVNEAPLDVMELQIKLTDPTVIAANRKSFDDNQSARQKVDAAMREEQSAEGAKAQREAEERDANCKIANQRFKRYTETRRLYRMTDDGERTYLDSKEIDTERLKAAQAVDKWCGQ